MKILKFIGIGVLLFVLVSSITYLVSDKIEYIKVDNFVEEPRVYVTDHGECYHTSGCHYLQSRNAIGLDKAKSQGYRACSYCKGVPSGTIDVNYYKTEIKDITNDVVIQSIIFASISTTVYAVGCVVYYLYDKHEKEKGQQA